MNRNLVKIFSPALVVEDSAQQLIIIKNVFKNCGFIDIEYENNVKSAINVINKKQIKLIVTDIFMPDQTGLDLAAAVRANSAMRATKIVLMTAVRDTAILSQTPPDMIDGLLLKPFTSANVLDVLNKILNPHTV